MQIKLNKFQELTMSYWLKARIAEIPSRDVLDMYNDTLWLAELLKGLVDEATKQFPNPWNPEIEAAKEAAIKAKPIKKAVVPKNVEGWDD
jgi:hypothetical protein